MQRKIDEIIPHCFVISNKNMKLQAVVDGVEVRNNF